MPVRHMPLYESIGIEDLRSKINPHNDKSEIQEDGLSHNAVEHVARAANDSIQSVSHEAKPERSEAASSTAILTSVDVPSQAGLEELHENLRTRIIDEERQKGSEKSAARRLAGPTDDYTPTPDSVAQAKAPVPGEVHWTGPPRESPLSAMYNDTLDLPSHKVEA